MRGMDLVLFVLHDLPVGGLFGQQLPTSTLQDGLHGAEAGADPRGEVEVLPLHQPSHQTHGQTGTKYIHQNQSKFTKFHHCGRYFH